MSHHSDDGMLIAGSDSFWEPGNYKKTTKRVEDGFRLSNEMITLIQERCEIEKVFAKSLRNWSKKWNELIEKGIYYFILKATFFDICNTNSFLLYSQYQLFYVSM